MGDHNGQLFGDSNGRIYGFPLSPSAMDTPFDYYNPVSPAEPSPAPSSPPSGNTNILENFKLIDLSNGQFVFVNEEGDKFEQNIESLSYNFDQRSYTVNTYNTTYNTTNNYYEYNYYTYNVQYTYNNTYVTYIGSTAEFVPTTYELYYELPDGRSSADLTEADIAGLSFQFHDMVNYKRSATDTSLRALYHFDGDTDDSSYWFTQGAFTWDKGASITYMESNAFNGALYLDEKEHQFTITLPSSIGSQDFTLQWRYYQNSATTTDNNENYVTVGGQKLLGWSEQSLYSLGTIKLSTGLSVGTWQELALVRHNGTLYIYHNGVKVASAAMSAVMTNKIVFYLGANSRAYSMLDELRVVNFAVAKGGAAYMPTVVPYDTNSVLVLPDGTLPVADEYWEFDTTIKPDSVFNFTTSVYPVQENFSNKRYNQISDNVKSSFMNLMYASGNFYFGDGFLTVQRQYFDPYLTNTRPGSGPSNGYFGSIGGAAFGIFLDDFSDVSGPYASSYPSHRIDTYTVNIVYSDGSQHAATGSLEHGCYIQGSTTDSITPFRSDELDFGPLKGRLMKVAPVPYEFYHKAATMLVLGCAPGYSSVDIVYIEVLKGDQHNTGHKKVSCLYDPTELQPNTAAIQTDIPVKGYTVGGVRPTFPVRGDVWMPVEGSRITGVQIYNGRAWEETNARYWTGSRWIPIYAFDLVTLQDMWDVSSSTGEDVIPPITSESGFWRWWQTQWLDFRAWLEKNGGVDTGPGTVYPDQGTCEHTHVERVLTQPTCTTTGTGLYVCTKCGDSYVQTIPANGHDWLMEDSILDELDEDGAVVEPGYDLYRCSVCGEEYKDFARTGPPGETDSSSLVQLIQHLFETLGELVGSLISWVLDLGATAMEGFAKVGEFFKKTAGEIKEFGGEFAAFLGSFFGIIPPELMSILSLAVLLLGLGLFIRHVLL